jgi:glycosyltransferase involved in cell wall biosynthesis
MLPEPSISIVIPVHNRAKIVNNTLDSIFAQTMRPVRLILVDNNSQDGTLDVLQQWKLAHQSEDFDVTVLSEPLPGAPRARNCGLNAVTTPYVLFFDSDDIMLPQHVEWVEEALKRYPDVDILSWDVHIQLPDGSFKSTKHSGTDYFYYHMFHSLLSTERYCARTELVRRVGGWNENVVGWDDWELSIRLLLESPTIKYLNHYAAKTLWQSDSITGADFSHCPEKWEHTMDVVAEYFSDKPRLMHLLEFKRIILAGNYTREGSAEGARLYHEVLQRDNSWIFKLAYRYVSLGGRGVARIFRMLHLI